MYLVLWYLHVFNYCFNCVYLVGCAKDVVWWWIHRMCMASGSICGVNVPWKVVGKSYVMVSRRNGQSYVCMGMIHYMVTNYGTS